MGAGLGGRAGGLPMDANGGVAGLTCVVEAVRRFDGQGRSVDQPTFARSVFAGLPRLSTARDLDQLSACEN